ncbi:hypothetical protein LguiA_036036 [Lonicera macranthoides]
MAKKLIFSFSGSLAIFFFFLASSGKEHFRAFLVYLINQLFLCFVTENKEIAIYLISIFALLILFFSLITIEKHDNDLSVSKFIKNFYFVICEGKQLLFFVFFGLIYLLLTVSGAEELVRALVGTLCLQVAFLNLFPFVIRSEREGQCCTCKAREISRKEEK